DQMICQLEIIKRNYNLEQDDDTACDLMLLQPKDKNIIPRVYSELADIEPLLGSDVYVVGNPMSMEDVLSDCRLIMQRGSILYYIGHSYFGNSGGGVYNKEGKLVGVVSFIMPIQPDKTIPAYVIHGATSLNKIKQFLQDIK
ncbi:MAG: serine protease, partial [Candidatus Margulisbacteria bacterium]|nr:serine protease [Candidatus Margulisiibacteriota bacterium]